MLWIEEVVRVSVENAEPEDKNQNRGGENAQHCVDYWCAENVEHYDTRDDCLKDKSHNVQFFRKWWA